MIRQSAIIDKIRDIPECPTHVAQVARDLAVTVSGEEGENIIVAALLDANMRSYELQRKIYELMETGKGYSSTPGRFDPKLVESLRELVG